LCRFRPLEASILDFVCKPEHRSDTGKRGRQLPTNRVDLITHVPATVGRLPRFIGADAIFDLGLSLGIDDFAMAISAARCATITAKAGSIADNEDFHCPLQALINDVVGPISPTK
jgi:hypothetical protein